MAVGGQASSSTVDQALTDLALGMRNLMTLVKQKYEWVTAMGGVTWLETAGYSAQDAATVMSLLGYMNGIAAVYFGTGTQASTSNFDAALAVLWAGQ